MNTNFPFLKAKNEVITNFWTIKIQGRCKLSDPENKWLTFLYTQNLEIQVTNSLWTTKKSEFQSLNLPNTSRVTIIQEFQSLIYLNLIQVPTLQVT